MYNVEKADCVMHEHTPQYSFGSKLNLEKPVNTPGGFFKNYFAVNNGQIGTF